MDTTVLLVIVIAMVCAAVGPMSRFGPRRPYPSVDRVRLRSLALIAVSAVAVGCAPSVAPVDDTPTSRQFPEEAAEIRQILDTMSDLDAADSEELAMAWEDLRSDLFSVTSDLERDAMSMELDGLVRRIESFRERFESAEGVRNFDPELERLTVKLGDVHDRVGR